MSAVPVHLYAGAAMLAIGLAKKVLMADPAGAISTDIFNAAGSSPATFFIAWLGAIAYTAQIYFDFSGYSDMALGISHMLGISLPINFNSPYKATSIIDFWRRWHITLSRFLRDYLYIPLGGNRKGEARRYLNLFITMLLGGIWHGAGWTFVIWGALHGAAQTLAHGWSALRKSGRLFAIPPLLGWGLTIVFVVFAWIPFRAPDLETTVSMWRGMVGANGVTLPAIGPLVGLAGRLGLETQAVGFDAFNLLPLTAAVLVALAAPNSQQLLSQFGVGMDTPGYDARNTPPRIAIRVSWTWAIFIGVLFGFALRGIGGYSEFIYFQF